MPPKQRITREMILDRAFAMFCSEGMEVVNARSVAKALNCSTQPIFSYFSGMQDLKMALDLKAQEMFTAAVVNAPVGECRLVSLYSAYIRFAGDHPHVFKHLYESVRSDPSRMDFFTPLAQEFSSELEHKEGLTKEQADRLIEDFTTYVCGLAALSLMRNQPLGDVTERLTRVYQGIRSHIFA